MFTGSVLVICTQHMCIHMHAVDILLGFCGPTVRQYRGSNCIRFVVMQLPGGNYALF